jgi:hypothetical protein
MPCVTWRLARACVGLGGRLATTPCPETGDAGDSPDTQTGRPCPETARQAPATAKPSHDGRPKRNVRPKRKDKRRSTVKTSWRAWQDSNPRPVALKAHFDRREKALAVA